MDEIGASMRLEAGEGSVLRVDAEGRLPIDVARSGEYYSLSESADGTITMTPVVVIPRRELERWLRTTDTEP